MSNFWWEGTKISPSLFLILVAKPFPRRMHGGCHCCHSETISIVVSLSSRDVPSELFNQRRFSHCSTNTSPISNKAWAIQWHASMRSGFATENAEKRRAYSSAFSSKIWHSRVICVFIRWGLTYIWHVFKFGEDAALCHTPGPWEPGVLEVVCSTLWNFLSTQKSML